VGSSLKTVHGASGVTLHVDGLTTNATIRAASPEGGRAAVTAEMTKAVAETGAFPQPELRVAVFTCEVPDGWWGGGGSVIRLPDIYQINWPPKPGMDGEPREAAAHVLAERGEKKPSGSWPPPASEPSRERSALSSGCSHRT
jgi:hypothetical protein